MCYYNYRTKRKENKGMQKYKEFEATQMVAVKRSLMTYSEAMANCYGYLTAMKDFGLLNEEQKTNEVNNMSYRFLNM